MKALVILVLSFAVWLILLYAVLHVGTAQAGVFFLERDGGWTEWRGLPDGGSR